MLTRDDIQFHSGPPALPFDQETLTAFVAAFQSVNVSRSCPAEGRDHLCKRLTQRLFHTVYGDIAAELSKLKAQLHIGMQTIDKDPWMVVEVHQALQQSISDIIEKMDPA